MPEEKQQPPGFKVVDRRGFTTDGSRRDSDQSSEEEPNPVEQGSSAGAADTGQAAPSPLPAAVSFQTLVSYLATTAMFQMGLLAGPSGERIPLDLANARRTLDLLGILQEKTQGNLTPEEARMLGEVLYELRLSFLEIQKRGP